MNDLPELLEQTADASAALRETREKAIAKALAAIRQIESSLLEALAGEKLKGLWVLAASPAYKVMGANLRAKQLDKMIDIGKSALILSVEGKLEICSNEGALIKRPCDDSDLRAEDVESIARGVEQVLREHLQNMPKTIERFAQIERLAQRVASALLQLPENKVLQLPEVAS